MPYKFTVMFKVPLPRDFLYVLVPPVAFLTTTRSTWVAASLYCLHERYVHMPTWTEWFQSSALMVHIVAAVTLPAYSGMSRWGGPVLSSRLSGVLAHAVRVIGTLLGEQEWMEASVCAYSRWWNAAKTNAGRQIRHKETIQTGTHVSQLVLWMVTVINAVDLY